MNLLTSLFRWRPPADDLATVLAERINERTGNRIRNLRVETVHGKVVVSGDVASRYLWQLALAAAAGGLDNPRRLEMHVNVNLQRQNRGKSGEPAPAQPKKRSPAAAQRAARQPTGRRDERQSRDER